MHIGLSDVIFSIVNFLVLMFVLYKCCWKMVVKVMKDRQQGITDSLNKAEEAKKEADETAGSGAFFAIFMWVIFALLSIFFLKYYVSLSATSPMAIKFIVLDIRRFLCSF